MADEELHETDSNNQKDWQSETSSSTVADETARKPPRMTRRICSPPTTPLPSRKSPKMSSTRLPLTRTSPTMTISIFLWTVSKRC